MLCDHRCNDIHVKPKCNFYWQRSKFKTRQNAYHVQFDHAFVIFVSTTLLSVQFLCSFTYTLGIFLNICGSLPVSRAVFQLLLFVVVVFFFFDEQSVILQLLPLWNWPMSSNKMKKCGRKYIAYKKTHQLVHIRYGYFYGSACQARICVGFPPTQCVFSPVS